MSKVAMKRRKNLTLRLVLYALGAVGTLYLIYESGAELAGLLQADDHSWRDIIMNCIYLLVWLALEWALIEKCRDCYEERFKR